MNLGTETGSVFNHLMSNGKQPEPKVGDGATVLMWTDRKAATIIKVTPKTITVRLDKATRTDTNGMSESQSYTYEADPEGQEFVFRLTKKGWRSEGRGLLIGHRQQYHDFSF